LTRCQDGQNTIKQGVKEAGREWVVSIEKALRRASFAFELRRGYKTGPLRGGGHSIEEIWKKGVCGQSVQVGGGPAVVWNPLGPGASEATLKDAVGKTPASVRNYLQKKMNPLGQKIPGEVLWTQDTTAKLKRGDRRAGGQMRDPANKTSQTGRVPKSLGRLSPWNTRSLARK